VLHIAPHTVRAWHRSKEGPLLSSPSFFFETSFFKRPLRCPASASGLRLVRTAQPAFLCLLHLLYVASHWIFRKPFFIASGGWALVLYARVAPHQLTRRITKPCMPFDPTGQYGKRASSFALRQVRKSARARRYAGPGNLPGAGAPVVQGTFFSQPRAPS
jgi:hypothetical protein